MAGSGFRLLEKNYIYLFHLDQFVILPTVPETIQDSTSTTFSSTSIMGRSAPLFAYSYSGPRTMQITLNLHRDLMTQINYNVSNLKIDLSDDYVDTLIKYLQAMALPKYSNASKMVDPPMIFLRLGNDIAIKGIIQGGVTTTYNLPLLSNGKYAQVSVSFNVSEVDPQDASVVSVVGGFRGLDTSLERRIWKI